MAECFNPCEPYAESSLFQIDANRDKFTPTLTIRTNKVRLLDMLLKYINFYGSTGHTRMVPDVFVLFFLEKKYLCHFDTRCLIQGYLALEGGQASKARKLKSFWQSWENGSINEIIVKVRVRIKVHNAMVNNGQKYFTIMPKQWSENIKPAILDIGLVSFWMNAQRGSLNVQVALTAWMPRQKLTSKLKQVDV